MKLVTQNLFQTVPGNTNRNHKAEQLKFLTGGMLEQSCSKNAQQVPICPNCNQGRPITVQSSTEQGLQKYLLMNEWMNQWINEQQGVPKLLQASPVYGHKPISKCQVSKLPTLFFIFSHRTSRSCWGSLDPITSCELVVLISPRRLVTPLPFAPSWVVGWLGVGVFLVSGLQSGTASAPVPYRMWSWRPRQVSGIWAEYRFEKEPPSYTQNFHPVAPPAWNRFDIIFFWKLS